MTATMTLPTAAIDPADRAPAPTTPTTTAARGRDRRRDAALALPLILVNATAILGQVGWANDHLTHHVLALAVLFAATVESIGVYLSYEAHAALLAGEAALKLRLGSYALAAVAGGLNYSHYAAHTWHPTVAAVTFGLLSSVSPWLWSIRSRSLHRQALHTAGLIDRRSARFAAAKWLHFPIRTLRAHRHAVDTGEQQERRAWHDYTDLRRRARTSARRRRARARRGASTAQKRDADRRPSAAMTATSPSSPQTVAASVPRLAAAGPCRKRPAPAPPYPQAMAPVLPSPGARSDPREPVGSRDRPDQESTGQTTPPAGDQTERQTVDDQARDRSVRGRGGDQIAAEANSELLTQLWPDRIPGSREVRRRLGWGGSRTTDALARLRRARANGPARV
jgi:hypothetical protein